MEEYIKSLSDMSSKLRDIVAPYDSMSFKEMNKLYKDELKMVAGQLNRLDIQSNSLILSVSIYEKFAKKPIELLELMKLCEIFVFRIYYIGNWRPYTAQSTIYSLTNRLYRGLINREDLIREMNNITEPYCPQDRMDQHLSNPNKNFYQWNGLRYLLYEYERKRCLEETGKKPAFEWEDLKGIKKEDSIEHILPQTIIEESGEELNYWTRRFDSEAYERNLNRLGNLTLSTRNSELGNNSFGKKKNIYKESSWQIERDIATDYKEWTEKEINQREQKLIDFAIERWRIQIEDDNEDYQ